MSKEVAAGIRARADTIMETKPLLQTCLAVRVKIVIDTCFQSSFGDARAGVGQGLGIFRALCRAQKPKMSMPTPGCDALLLSQKLW